MTSDVPAAASSLKGEPTAAVLLAGGATLRAAAAQAGVAAFITASVAAYFVDHDEESALAEEMRLLHQRLDRLEQLLEQPTGPSIDRE